MSACDELIVSADLAGRGAHQHDAFLRHDERSDHATEMLHRLLHDALQLIRVVARVRAGGRGGVGQQQREILVERGDRAIEIVDERAREQVTPQALECGSQEGMREREAAHWIRLAAAARATDHGDDRDEGLLIVAQPAEVDRRTVLERAQLTRAIALRTRVRQDIHNEIGEIGAGRGFARPAHVTVRVEHRHADRAWHQRSNQLRIRLE